LRAEREETMVKDLKVGDALLDNDPRTNGRALTVVAVGDAKAVCDTPKGRRVFVDLTRIHNDGKPRRTGFDVRAKEDEIRQRPDGVTVRTCSLCGSVRITRTGHLSRLQKPAR
jgi:hypothetical protein